MLKRKSSRKIWSSWWKIEFGEDPDESFVQEVFDETGVKILPLELVDIFSWNYQKEEDKI
ncbi:MAG: hypothetical protein Fur0024_5390 [Patescibacteria group bacterium]